MEKAAQEASRPQTRRNSFDHAGQSLPQSTFNPFEELDISPNFTFHLPQDHQIQMQSDLTADWPWDLGSGLFGPLE